MLRIARLGRTITQMQGAAQQYSVRRKKEPVQTHYYTNVLVRQAERLRGLNSVRDEEANTKTRSEVAETVEETMRAMAAAGAPISPRCLSTLLEVCFRVGDGPGASAVYAAFAERGGGQVENGAGTTSSAMMADRILVPGLNIPARMAPNSSHQTQMVVGLARLGRLADAQAMFDAIRAKGRAPSLHAYASLIAAQAKAGAFEDAETTLGLLAEDGGEPNTVIYTALIDGYGKVGKLDAAADLFALMEAGNPDVAPNAVTYTAMINNYAAAGDWDSALSYFDALCASGHPVEFPTYSAILHRAQEQDRADLVSRFQSELATFNVPTPFGPI